MPRSREQYNAYMAAYMKAQYDRRHAAAVAQLGGHCARCEVTDDLQFDHIDPSTKTMTIAKMWTASEVRFQAELAKCQLLCVRHHLEKTLAERGFTAGKGRHGTAASYRYCGPPKCEACKLANTAYQKEWRAKQALQA
jgi:hypothetical protein